MAHRIPARLTAAEGRKFAFTVGIAFLVIAGISKWRGHELPPLVLGGLGAAFVLAGLVAPSHLAPVQRAWMGLALAISKVTTPIFMGIVYFLVLTPIGLMRRLAGHNSMQHPVVDSGYWNVRTADTSSDLTRQF